MEEKQIIIEGFCFTEEETAKQAKREADGIRYIVENTDMENPEMVWHLYHKLIAENLFETPVGISFLKEMRDYLAAVPSMKEQELQTIPVKGVQEEKGKEKDRELRNRRRERMVQAENSRTEKRIEQMKKNLRASLFGNLFLVILVIGMIIITMTNDNPNILNYESKIINKYAQWQQELEDREQAVREQEQKLKITP